MASVQYLFSLTNTYSDELFATQSHLDVLTKFRNDYAIILQRYWRGFKAWKEYQTIRKAIVTIQAYYRGWKVRINLVAYQEQHELDLEESRRNRAAIKIQAWWRGVVTRKYMKGKIPKEMLAERKRVKELNDEMALRMRELLQENLAQQRLEEDKISEQKALIILYKCHYLMRTYVSEGIYSCHGKKNLSLIEALMKSLPFKDYMDQLHKLYYALVKDSRLTKDSPLKEKKHRVPSVDQTRLYHKNRFVLSSRVSRTPYQRSPLNEDRYAPVKENVCRPTMEASKNVSSHDFSLDVVHLNLDDRHEPYHIDYWETEIFGRQNVDPDKTEGCL